MPLPRRLLRALALMPSLCVGCSLVFPAPVPMRSVQQVADDHHRARCAMVFLPGFGDDEHAFVDHGFADALRARSLKVDTIFAGATFGYYAKKTILARLREDVLKPVVARGYEQVWVVGVSMGGLGALLLAKQPDVSLAGVYLLAPYLGEDDLLREIDHAGGIAKWEPGSPSEDYTRELWRYLKAQTQRPDAAPLIYLGAGDHDKLRYGHRILTPALPPSRVFSVPGGHDWGPWLMLWARFLDESDFRARCS